MVSVLTAANFLLFCQATPSATAVAVDVRVEPESKTVTVAEQLLVEVSVTTARNPENVVLASGRERAFDSEIRRFSISGFDRVDSTQTTKMTETTVTDVWAWRFDPGLPGETEIPALTILSRPTTGSGQTITTTTEPISIETISILPADPLEAELRPEAKPRVSWAVRISIAVMGVIWILTIVFLRDRGPPPPEPDPVDVAREQLLATLDSTTEPAAIRGAVLAFESAAGASAGEIWTGLDESRFAKSELPIGDDLKSQIRAFAVK